ncbi:taurine ABC transporter ATP-binding protein [Paenirhodobacter populi]|uniref:ATP-binding cassette domain-containing protein n=1 Tax=Paenirhodobacter populi TaxID=2306993 RepID=A0A443INP6_9RHOB|nr:ATP-binding cassette domain-containing protein [Sinirhodobacter populi]RWR07215.1 ATP-binding cassette domain-containing protein [Sinirhodobacter populi]
MSLLSFDDVSLDYSTQGAVLSGIGLSFGRGEFLTVIGRSGSGKTSLLNLAAGFLAPSRGRITLDGAPVTGPGRERAVVFQDDALFPWLTVRENVAFALRLSGRLRAERLDRAEALLAGVGLAGQGGKRIWQLSGGQRQRVGIARALAADPAFLLMDEPLGALDAMTRDRMQELLLRVWSDSGAGVLLITHSVEEALFLATRVLVLAPDPGRIVIDRAVYYGQRFLDGETSRALRAEPGFIALREELVDAIHAGEEANHA